MLRRLFTLPSFLRYLFHILLNRNRFSPLIPMGRFSSDSLNPCCLCLRLLAFGNYIDVPILGRLMMMPFRRPMTLTGPMMGYMPMPITALRPMPRNMLPLFRRMMMLRLSPTPMLGGSCSPISSGGSTVILRGSSILGIGNNPIRIGLPCTGFIGRGNIRPGSGTTIYAAGSG